MALTLEYAFTIAADLGEIREVGKTHAGVRRVIPIVGGTVTGPSLTGDVLPGGADWNVVRPDGAIHIWARYEIRISDGPIVSVVNEGLAYFDAAAPDAGNTPSIPTHPVFEVPDGGPMWLATGFFLGELKPGDGHVTIDVSRVRTAADEAAR